MDGDDLKKQQIQQWRCIKLVTKISIIIILMTKNEAKPISLGQLRQYNTNRILTNNFNATTLNVKVASNPFLKDQEKYHYLIYKLNDYNKRVLNAQVTDQYEALYYERLHTIICDIAFLETKVDQIARLEETFNWAKEQEHLITQRLNQGEIRYQVTKQARDMPPPEKKDIHVSQKSHVDELPSQTVAKAQLPFKKGWRTTHKELDIPARRLNEYKRKILNIAPFIEPKQQKKAPKVTYPKIPKLEYKQQEPEEAQQPQQGQQGEQPPQDGSAPAVPGEVKDGQAKQGEEAANAADQQQDLGGFGQQPAQPEQQQPPEETDDDKLAPRLKSYVLEYKDINRKQYKGSYMFYKGEQSQIERRMEEKYLRIFNDQIKRQKQDKQAIEITEEWAARKAKMQKQHQKRLENSMFTGKYNLSNEEPAKIQALAPADELRFGFTQNLRKPKTVENIQLSSAYLPRIGQQKLFEKSIRKDRINSLKSKFGKLLNLQEYEQREVNQSLCQYSSRKRGLSQIIRNHSKSKERISQLDEVVRIKQKLARNKVGIDVRSLSMGLCLPEDEDSTNQSAFPDKSLPSNPFMVQTKKKKKKK